MIKTLVLYSTGASKRDVIINSNLGLFLDLLKKFDKDIKKINNQKIQKLYHYITSPYECLSYVNDWKEAIENCEELECSFLNVLNVKYSYDYISKRLNDFDLIILLHSVVGDNLEVIKPFSHVLKDRKGKLVSFIGNEYSLLKEKKNFLREIDVDFIASQLPKKAYKFIYEDMSAKLISAPHGLNQRFYKPGFKKDIDISFVGARYPDFIGDQDRNLFIEYFAEHTSKFNNHISIGKNKNVPRHLWRDILQNSQGTIGAEAGTKYLDINGELMSIAQKFCQKNPKSTFEDLISEVFNRNKLKYVSGKAISSRHIEPIGTKTCQILLEGDYNGILKKNEHYISVKKDYSNLQEALGKFLDPKIRSEIIENSYEYVLSNHTYDSRIKTILNNIN